MHFQTDFLSHFKEANITNMFSKYFFCSSHSPFPSFSLSLDHVWYLIFFPLAFFLHFISQSPSYKLPMFLNRLLFLSQSSAFTLLVLSVSLWLFPLNFPSFSHSINWLTRLTLRMRNIDAPTLALPLLAAACSFSSSCCCCYFSCDILWCTLFAGII